MVYCKNASLVSKDLLYVNFCCVWFFIGLHVGVSGYRVHYFIIGLHVGMCGYILHYLFLLECMLC